jgi:hypothetical protein
MPSFYLAVLEKKRLFVPACHAAQLVESLSSTLVVII